MNECDLLVRQHLPADMCQAELSPWEQTYEWKRIYALDKLRFLEESNMQKNDHKWYWHEGQGRECLHRVGKEKKGFLKRY